MSHSQPHVNYHPVHNRVLALMAHTTRYAFKGESRLAADSGVSKSAVCRLINGQSSPSFALVCALTKALEKHLGKSLDPRELVSFDGSYPTPSVCELVGCKGCLPQEAYDEHDVLRDEFRGIKPGQWSPQPSLTLEQSLSQQNIACALQEGAA
jgi:transcriptional regulator with XRE-family HTH domain